jgi:hypothetical protein
MNKKLLLALYVRSGLGAYMPVDYKGHELAVEEHIEKFAELIVRQCVSIVAKRKDQAIDDGWNIDEAMSMAEMDLLEHFGVEE